MINNKYNQSLTVTRYGDEIDEVASQLAAC
jgi:hypothetical protein